MWNVGFKIEDGEKQALTTGIYMPATATYADVVAFALLFAAQLDQVCGGKVISYTITNEIPTIAGSVKAAAIEGSRVDSGATLSFRNAASRAWSFYVPTYLSTKLSNKLVVETDAEFIVVRDALITGAATALPTDENALRLSSFRKGKQSTR
jgi:hypothetical protein